MIHVLSISWWGFPFFFPIVWIKRLLNARCPNFFLVSILLVCLHVLELVSLDVLSDTSVEVNVVSYSIFCIFTLTPFTPCFLIMSLLMSTLILWRLWASENSFLIFFQLDLGSYILCPSAFLSLISSTTNTWSSLRIHLIGGFQQTIIGWHINPMFQLNNIRFLNFVWQLPHLLRQNIT